MSEKLNARRGEIEADIFSSLNRKIKSAGTFEIAEIGGRRYV